MNKIYLIHPALPDPSSYLRLEERRQYVRKRHEHRMRIAFGAGLLVGVGVFFYLFGVVLFSVMPE